MHVFPFELLMLAASRVIFVNFSTLYCFASMRGLMIATVTYTLHLLDGDIAED